MRIEKLFFKIVKLRDCDHLFFTFAYLKGQVFKGESLGGQFDWFD